MTETYYKWLLPDRRTPVQGVKWPKRVGAWTEKETPVLCESGWHGVERKDVLKHFPRVEGAELWRVEIRGELIHGVDKFAASSMRLVELVAKPDDLMLRLFACDVAEDVLHLYEDRYPNDTRPRDCIAVACRYAMGEASEEELASARDAARDAALDADIAMASARDAAMTAALDADIAMTAALDADIAMTAAWAAAWGDARDADIAMTAAWAAARASAWDAAWADAWDAAWGDAWAAAWAKYNDWFCERLGI